MTNKDDDLIERTEIILNQANLLFNRLENNFSLLKNRVSTFFAILVATMSFLLTISLQIISSSSVWGLLLLISPFLFFMIVSGILLATIFTIKKYTDVEIFENERFEEIRTLTKIELLSDFLFYVKKCYEYNDEKYSKEVKRFKYSFILYIIGNTYILVILISFIISNTNMG